MERICDWGAETRAALGKYGARGQSFCRQLFEGTPEQLRRCAALTDDVRSSEFSEILFGTPDIDTITIEELVHGFNSKCSEFEAALAVLSQLTFSTQLPLSQLATLVQLLDTIENQRRSVEGQTSKLGLVQPTEQIIEEVEKLKSTRESAEVIAAANMPAPVKRWLYQGHAKSRCTKG